MEHAQTVFVGLSGGVDSSVAALRLLKQGYNVVGVFIKVWQPSFLNCNWEQERLDAMRVAAKLQIPFLTCDAEKAYKDDVADYFIESYKKGITPNPDVMCNKYVKFGAFLDFANAHGADFIATGHYAQVRGLTSNTNKNKKIFKIQHFLSSRLGLEPENREHGLYRGVDTNKDQTYFLWTLTQEQLSKTLFPVGNSPKSHIRKEAEKAGLITAQKKDSQGVCFLGHIDIPEFLSHYITLKEGKVLNEDGEVIGTHKGALVYTTGQRHGFTLTNQDNHRSALYVTDRNIEQNTITVGTQGKKMTKDETFKIHSINLIGYKAKEGQHVDIQTRYRQRTTGAVISSVSSSTLQLTVQTATEVPTSGQSCVLYKGTRCLGGGIIS